jgi:hypothetical protein
LIEFNFKSINSFSLDFMLQLSICEVLIPMQVRRRKTNTPNYNNDIVRNISRVVFGKKKAAKFCVPSYTLSGRYDDPTLLEEHGMVPRTLHYLYQRKKGER